MTAGINFKIDGGGAMGPIICELGSVLPFVNPVVRRLTDMNFVLRFSSKDEDSFSSVFIQFCDAVTDDFLSFLLRVNWPASVNLSLPIFCVDTFLLGDTRMY